MHGVIRRVTIRGMRIKVIACKVFAREIALLAAESRHVIDVTYLQQGLHNTPDALRTTLQEEIDRIDAGSDLHTQAPPGGDGYHAIVLAYGLCSNAIVGVRSAVHTLVVPRAHDCIAMIIGSHERYRTYFDAHPGTYWYTPGWIDQTLMPGQKRLHETRSRYVEEYGEDNAQYLMEIEQEWLRKYNRCTYATWRRLDRDAYQAQTQEAARYLGWKYDTIETDEGMMRRLLEGQWNPEEVLMVPPGQTIEPSYDDDVIGATE